ncbi:hypothetical protein WJX74_002999 [Apatococcus lobatus]|uniref:RING-type domain-containing protein n=1 Tax=Apatococcus lobatus TaxID=904363 RepID=A0AAW1SDY0_9CHLO
MPPSHARAVREFVHASRNSVREPQLERMRRASDPACPFEVTGLTVGVLSAVSAEVRGQTGTYDVDFHRRLGNSAAAVLCRCPDAHRARAQGTAVLCKHACWLLMRVGGHLDARAFNGGGVFWRDLAIQHTIDTLIAMGPDSLRDHLERTQETWAPRQQPPLLSTIVRQALESEQRGSTPWAAWSPDDREDTDRQPTIIREREWSDERVRAARQAQARFAAAPTLPVRGDTVPAHAEEECPICYTPFGGTRCVRCTACPGLFHRLCAARWGKSCPLCRHSHQFADLAEEVAPVAPWEAASDSLPDTDFDSDTEAARALELELELAAGTDSETEDDTA